MKKEIRNKVLIVLAGLSFIGITAGVGIGLQRSALNSSYRELFKNDKSETKLNPPINDADLVAAISNFSLKPEWSKISASQAFKLHTDPLYAFKLSQAVDFSKVDNKFSDLFFDIQVTEETKVESNSIKNLTVFVFDKKTKKEVASRAFSTSLSGFSTIANQDFLENFIAESSKYNLDKSQLTKKFASDSIFPSAFALKFQDQLLTNLRKISPEIFSGANVATATQVSALSGIASQFQQQGGGGNGGTGAGAGGSAGTGTDGASGSGASTGSTGSNGATGDTGSAGAGAGAQGGASQPTTPTPSPETPETPKAPEVPLVSKLKPTNSNLELAFKQTLESFGGLELIAASGLQSLIPNEYTLLPVTSEKSLVKIDIDDTKGTAKIWLKLLDQSNKEKLIGLDITGLSSVESVQNKIFTKINKNQNKYISLKPQVAEYFRKNPGQSLAKLISDYQKQSSAADSKVAKVFEEYLSKPDSIKKAIMGESSGTTTPAQPESSGQVDGETQSEFEKQLKQLASAGDQNSKDAVKKYLKDEYNIDVQTDSATSTSAGTGQTSAVAVQTSVAGLTTTSEPQAQQQQQESQVQEQHVEQQQQESQQQQQQESQAQEQQPKEPTVEEIAKKDKAFYAPYFEIYNYQLPTMQSQGQSVLVTPDKIDFWFETNSNLKVGDYNFDFSIDPKQDESSSAKTLKLNVNFQADSNFKLEVSPENVPYLEIYDGITKPKVQSTESQAVNVAVATTPAAQESYKFTGWTFPITIDFKGSKTQQELEKLVGNNHKVDFNNSLPYLLFQSDLDNIFKTAKLDSWFSLSDSEKNQAKAYLKTTLNPISVPTSLQKPQVEAAPAPAAPANPPANPSPSTPAPDSSATPGTSATPAAPTSPAASGSGSGGSAAGAAASGASSGSSSSSTSSGTTAAATAASSVANSATPFQDSATPAQEETFALGDYLINYLDKFGTFNLGQGQKLAISSHYDEKNRSYNFVFEVRDSDNDAIASSVFGFVGINKNNNALKKSLAYGPDVFIDGSSGLEYHAHDGTPTKPILTNISSANSTAFQFKVNNFTDNSALDNLLQDNGFYNQRATNGKGLAIKQPLIYEFDGEGKQIIKTFGRQVEKSTLDKGVLYFTFKLSDVLAKPDTLLNQSYKLLSTAPDAREGSFGATNLELFRTFDEKDTGIFTTLNLGWRIEKARSLAIDKSQVPTTEADWQTKGLVVFRDADATKPNEELKLHDYTKEAIEKLQQAEFDNIIKESKSFFGTGTNGASGGSGDQTQTASSPKINIDEVNEIFRKYWPEPNNTDFLAQGQGPIYEDGIWFNHTRPNANVALESFLDKTLILEVRIDDSSVTFSLIAQREPNQDPYVWTSQLKSIYKDAKRNINPDTPIGVLFGRGIDYSQIGDRIINSLDDSSTKERDGITFKSLAVFKGDRLLKDDKARLEVRKAFIDQYFK
ncbi:P110/LppT family adhesin N-terminal domain [Mesomycoplasma ovipneumoniae]|uniref:P110/LppT family adhesin N-terminal domain n=1 Tax=Mesomycoplasma ovipneumoniae TaxID=29562 RepID=A0AAJ2UD05_9BACT|nr:P110/LppT family adhesin N-terminal domain [Mesomycoplasma ovipneumoniae]MDW2829480.1 P110/LppT family adhesin N-terminal domain [Mesomycoplasma ovipneumoniae]MDW2871217.1 P110/LppT family adhesin N-terminal domain [Mesomycoplasma ovipneumoniae]MDW2893213.1 P110/LppT family adhesin N-terminal domain [Mesomycoplasma ovipneumoniae]